MIHFLSGLPRTGSTLLGSILNQDSRLLVTPTSPLYPLLVNVNECFNVLNIQYTFDPQVMDRTYKGLIGSFYGNEKRIIFDKHRGWPKHVEAIKQFINPEPRIICTVRPIVEILTSYIVLADRDPDNFIDTHLRKEEKSITNENRALLLWTTYLKTSYDSLVSGLKTHAEYILLIQYDELITNPDKAIDNIYDFCGISRCSHHYNSIENTCSESKDEGWGMKNLHTIRPKLQRQSADPLNYLPHAAIDYFSQFDVRA